MNTFQSALLKFSIMIAAICFNIVVISVAVRDESIPMTILFAILLFLSIFISIVRYQDLANEYYKVDSEDEE